MNPVFIIPFAVLGVKWVPLHLKYLLMEIYILIRESDAMFPVGQNLIVDVSSWCRSIRQSPSIIRYRTLVTLHDFCDWMNYWTVVLFMKYGFLNPETQSLGLIQDRTKLSSKNLVTIWILIGLAKSGYKLETVEIRNNRGLVEAVVLVASTHREALAALWRVLHTVSKACPTPRPFPTFQNTSRNIQIST